MVKIAGISGSPRKEKNTEGLLKIALEHIQKSNPRIKTEFFSLAGKNFSGCIACDFCKKNFSCSQKDDLFPILEAFKDPEIKGIIVASPVYMGGISSQTKAFLDRSVLFRRNQFQWKGKVGGALVVGGSRNGGQEYAIHNIHAAMMIHDMIIVPDSAPTSHFGATGWERVECGIFNDPHTIDTVKNLATNMAHLVEKLFL